MRRGPRGRASGYWSARRVWRGRGPAGRRESATNERRQPERPTEMPPPFSGSLLIYSEDMPTTVSINLAARAIGNDLTYSRNPAASSVLATSLSRSHPTDAAEAEAPTALGGNLSVSSNPSALTCKLTSASERTRPSCPTGRRER